VTDTAQQVRFGRPDEPATIGHLIGGRWVNSSSDDQFQTRNPHDGSLVATVARGTAEDGRAAIAAARSAFDDGPWPRMTPRQRQKVLHDVADAIDAHGDELARIETRDAGKTITQARHAEIPRAAHNLRFFADYAAGCADECYPDGGLLSYTLHPAAGVVAAISPWNAPLLLSTWKVAPALAFGNTVVLKPAPQAPLSAARFGELALAAGLPDGVLNIVHGYGEEEVAGPLVADPRVDRITFTGSSATGARILAAAAPNLTPVSAELGGRSATIVFDDVDLDIAVPIAVRAVFAGNGQVCVAGSRLLVHRRILGEFTDRFVEQAQQLPVGDPADPATFVGPLIEQRHLDKVSRYVELAQQEGGQVLTGGFRLTDDEHAAGFYYPPTVITGLTNADRAVREEIFGPVETILSFDTEDQAIAIANDSPYGLAGILLTDNLDRAHSLASRWRAGTVWVNCFFERDLRLPFGGEGRSGVGREGGRYSRDFFTEPRAVSIRQR
jgi:aminomuconate-semialdehyde/2-hydroxymuconate-6-semialdehyde dehydrogenase